MAYTQMTSLYNSSQNELVKLEKVARQLHDKIKNMKTSLELAELEKQKNISTMKERLKTLREQECSLVQDINLLHGIVEKDNEEHFRLKREASNVQEMLHEEQNQLRHWKDCKSEPLERFGPQISALVEAVDNVHSQGHFTHKPLGPLGACIRLRDPEFALAIECCLNGLLLHFFCDNHNDELILQGLMKNFFPSGSPQPQIIVSAFDCELYDVTGRAADHPEFPTVLEALEIPDAVVTNTLIDMKGIQSVLLIKSNSVAHAVMQGEEFPKNCRKILTACGDEVFEGCYSPCEKSRPTYLGDMDIEMHNLEKEVENKTAQLSAFHQHINLLENDLKQNRETIDSHYKNLTEMTVQRIDITSEIKDLENLNENQSKEILGLESVAQEIKESIKEVEKKIQSRKSEMENLRQVRINSEEKLKDFVSKFNQISNLSKSFMEERNDAGSEVSIRYNSVRRCAARLEQQLYYIQNIKEELDMKKRELQRETPLAKYICPERMEVTRTASVLYKEINMLKETIKSEISTHGNREEIRNQYLEVKEKYAEVNGEVKNLKKLVINLNKMATQKFVSYKRLRKCLSIQCKFNFDTLLSQWSFCGKIHLDHEKETVSISIQPGVGSRAALDTMNAFSDGSHTFSNFLFILTLWSTTESPFRCFDSFDFYMDRNQRKIAMDMILQVAHFQPSHQFLLFVPQYMRYLLPSSPAEIVQIPEPEREVTPPPQEINSEEESQ
uniref:Structural maintenance of chromosomes protein 6 n=1 Tax=Sarcophilus harrisii TaxID=9305 RepID=G3VDC0_SARHA